MTDFLTRAALASASLLLLAATTPAPRRETLTVEVADVRNANGIVHVDLCPKDKFLKDDCPFSGDAPAIAGTTTVTIADVPEGQYAAQVFHDENRNGSVDQALFGIPREGIGFSNDAKIRLGPPSFAEAVFDSGRTHHIRLKMRYFLQSKVTKGPR